MDKLVGTFAFEHTAGFCTDQEPFLDIGIGSVFTADRRYFVPSKNSSL
jgi:hypothetical protein